jgi:predicted dehydrogenase
MASNGLRVGVVGVGFGTTVHVPAFVSEGWDVVAICSRSAERVGKAATDLGIANRHTDYRELVAREDIDVVAVVTPPMAHAEVVLAALEAGKHVLCEKPFALSAAEAQAMLDGAEKRGLTGMVAHEFRFTPQRSHAKQLIDDGYVGTLRSIVVEASYAMVRPGRALTWAGQRALGGGQLGAIGSHFLDSIRFWMGDITSVSARLSTLRPDRVDPVTGAPVQADADDTFTIQLTFANGATGTFAYTAAAPVALGARVTIIGDDGTLSLSQPGVNPTSDDVVYGGQTGATQLAELPLPERFVPFEDDRDRRLVAFRLLVREFERGIREGGSPSPSFTDGLRVQQVLDAVRESSARGMTVAVG